MPWKEPGKGDKDPWSSGNQPPDLDDVFRNVGSKVKSIFGGGGGSGRDSSESSGSGGIISLIILLLVFWIGWDAVHIIDAAERGVVTRFGKFSRELEPGINLTLPRPFEAVVKVNVSEVKSVDDRGHMLTEDENLVEFNYQVQYRIASAQDFLFEVRSPEITLRQAAESALRESVGTNGLDDILEGSTRELVRQETRRVLQETLDSYQAGLLITQFNLTDVTVPAQVQEAYSDVIRAREDRERFIEEARVHANSVIPEARGAAARIVQEAQGYRDATIALAEGEADRFTAMLTEYQLAPEVTRKRLYLQTLESVLSRSRKVLLDVDASGNVLYLPLDQLGAGGDVSGRLPPIVSPDSSATQPVDRNAPPGRTANREGRR
ncbi:MAG: FtsH protease activity modulator HflK [Xanthomonadales bacterium]|nr:FtsH protease activity modulator HflK [Xanthomonadales bacterium]NIX12519.1 FtsH protease activity modulator HflK [Xanthomonadales bacterium]